MAGGETVSPPAGKSSMLGSDSGSGHTSARSEHRTAPFAQGVTSGIPQSENIRNRPKDAGRSVEDSKHQQPHTTASIRVTPNRPNNPNLNIPADGSCANAQEL
ncbi:hypothetical protein GCM10017566_66720 [Amycolatopsis bartoniae]|uniref:Uncharacterized protein n=1 Tax=Amycolatopsis bartoniae TaxID=941986 RepID=A0A8H9IZM3_9PSEU|nr:hypothetical protein GCM10017566_66720 [Amycolatopsis bartoniae]